MSKELRNFVFSGGALMGPAQLGSYNYLESIYNPKAFCGTSIGALNAAFLSQGYSSDRVISKIKSLNMKSLVDKNYLNLFSFNEQDKLGIIKGQKIHEEFKKLFPEKFKELQYPLSIVTTDINKRECFIFNSKDTPEAYVYDALRASISLPGIFAPFKYEDKLLIDGGITENFYLDCFKDSEYKTIGIKVNDNNDFDKITTLKDLLLQTLYTSMIRNEYKNIINNPNSKVIKIVVDVNVFDFENFNNKILDYLIETGYNQTKQIME